MTGQRGAEAPSLPPDATDRASAADICLILEGSYPFVSGGVSSWMHNVIQVQSHLTFHLFVISALPTEKSPRYKLPPNVTGLTEIFVQRMPAGAGSVKRQRRLFASLQEPLIDLAESGSLDAFASMVRSIAPLRDRLGQDVLMNSEEAFRLVVEMYRRSLPNSSFLNYFWSWRSLIGGMFACMIAPLPQAKVFHAISTGYAGLVAARAKVEHGRPALLTEHGIYTNERRVEILMADWLEHDDDEALSPEAPGRDLRDLWIDTFEAYSRVCYGAVDEIITLYGGNQDMQRQGGAPPEKLRLIPNGVDCDRWATVPRKPAAERDAGRATIAFIGRVVPIKDVKTFLRAMAFVHRQLPEVQVVIAGPADEDPQYARECRALAQYSGLTEVVDFAGPLNLVDHMGRFDVVVLTSISEAQPLVVMEAGACGIPVVTTNVGSCSELVYGRPNEEPNLGAGGAVTPLAAPQETGREILRLLTDQDYYRAAATALESRMRTYYDAPLVSAAYRDTYNRYVAVADAKAAAAAE
ncbi:MAG: GT4 family glycosyltransferase PelF [Sneathiellaceae bacterium]